MLFIKRKIGESLRVNEDVHIKVINVQGRTVTLGAVFSEGSAVWREEIFQKIQQEKLLALGETSCADEANSEFSTEDDGEDEDTDESCVSEGVASCGKSSG